MGFNTTASTFIILKFLTGIAMYFDSILSVLIKFCIINDLCMKIEEVADEKQ